MLSVNKERKLTPEIRDVIVDRNTVLIIGTLRMMVCAARPGVDLT
jgi:hypothetical protein